MAKIKVEAGKTIDSPRELAKSLLPKGASKTQVTELTKKIKTLNNLGKNSDITEASGEIRVGKINTVLDQKKVKLKDKSTKNKFNFVTATPQGGGISIGASSVESSTPVTPAIKTAPIDAVQFVDEALSAELLLDLLFEDVGGQELLTIARNDTVNGQDVVYQPFKNLGILQEIYNPTNLLKLQDTSDKIFSNFTINLLEKIPRVGNGANGANYYLDLVNGDGVIELINMRSDEQVEIQIANAGTIEDIGI
jgi:ribosomal protein L11